MVYRDFPTREKRKVEFWAIVFTAVVVVLVLACIECFRLDRQERVKEEGYAQMAAVMPCR